jgi:hypothetical protein
MDDEEDVMVQVGQQEGSVELQDDIHNARVEVTEEDLAECLASQIPIREWRHAEEAIGAAEEAGFFASGIRSWVIDPDKRARNAQGADLRRLLSWNSQMVEDVQRQNYATTFEARSELGGPSDEGTTIHLASSSGSQSQAFSTENAGVILLQAESEMPSIDPGELNEHQYRAYEIITNHLKETLAGRSCRTLRMILYGEGGTGKSKIIQTVTDAFVKAGTTVSWYVEKPMSRALTRTRVGAERLRSRTTARKVKQSHMSLST